MSNHSASDHFRVGVPIGGEVNEGQTMQARLRLELRSQIPEDRKSEPIGEVDLPSPLHCGRAETSTSALDASAPIGRAD
jgi:hypothetical protein